MAPVSGIGEVRDTAAKQKHEEGNSSVTVHKALFVAFHPIQQMITTSLFAVVISIKITISKRAPLVDA
jgi:hypothetical protein